MRKLENGTLIGKTKYEAERLTDTYTTPFSGITEAFKKFRNGEDLEGEVSLLNSLIISQL